MNKSLLAGGLCYIIAGAIITGYGFAIINKCDDNPLDSKGDIILKAGVGTCMCGAGGYMLGSGISYICLSKKKTS